MFQFEADHEKEDCEQCVRGPDTKAEFEAQGRDADFVVDQADVSVTPGRIDPDQCDRGSGAATIGADDFESKLAMSLYQDGAENDRDENEGWIPTTKKKGPRRRLPKRQRTNRVKIRKL